MKKFLTVTGITLAVIILSAITVIGGAFMYAQYETSQFRANNIDNAPSTTVSLDLADYPEVPDPVAQYFEYTFNGQDSITVSSVNWREDGEFMLPVGDYAINARQTSTAIKPVYLWQGVYSNTVVPVPMLDSRDGFLIDDHDMRARVLGLMKVMHSDYTEQADIDALHSYLMLRYYGTAVDFPWALLPNEYISWSAKDDTHAYLNIDYKNYKGSYLVSFNDQHQITKMETETTMLHGNFEELREVGEKLNYEEINGFMVPTRMQYYWYYADNLINSEYNFDISDIEYNS